MTPCALAIGGLDPGGGAGIAADLRAFHAVGVFGCAVVALLTVQSTDGLVASAPVAAKLVVRQAEEVCRAERVNVIKVGALGSVANVRAVASWLSRVRLPVVLDPVLVPTRGASRLLVERATRALCEELLPRATLVTANAHEAEVLTGRKVRTVRDATRAARALVGLGARAALVKGGHLAGRLDGGGDAVDVLAFGGDVVRVLRARRLTLPPLHGGGCVLASLIAGLLASRRSAGGRRRARLSDDDLEAAVRGARRRHRGALRHAVDIGGALRVLVP